MKCPYCESERQREYPQDDDRIMYRCLECGEVFFLDDDDDDDDIAPPDGWPDLTLYQDGEIHDIPF